MHYQTKIMLKEAICNFSTFVYNLLYFVKHSQSENELSTLRNLVLSLPREVKAQYAEECAYIEAMSIDELHSIVFPYPMTNKHTVNDIVAAKEKGLPYVLHAGAHKLFFPRCFSLQEVEGAYRSLVEREGLLGTGCLAKSPHCYQGPGFNVESDDILLDIGCAEAIFTLDNIDKISKAYLFECAPEWRKPLQCTFAPYSDKVVLVDKLVSDTTHGKSTTLIDVVRREMSENSHFFVKMDIEGWERIVLRGNAEFFQSAKIKLSCCVYHRQDDAQVIDALLKEMGFKTRFTDGYMLTTMNGIHYPYFRHALIYACNYE